MSDRAVSNHGHGVWKMNPEKSVIWGVKFAPELIVAPTN
jgi:hypothetical protein